MNCVDYEKGIFDSFEKLDCKERLRSSKGSRRSNRSTKGSTRSNRSSKSSTRSNRSSKGSTNKNKPNVVEWEEFWDDNANAKYYYNHKTGEANWIKPPDGKYKQYKK